MELSRRIPRNSLQEQPISGDAMSFATSPNKAALKMKQNARPGWQSGTVAALCGESLP